MKRRPISNLIVRLIVWLDDLLDDLQVAINKRRFEKATELAKLSATAPRIYVTKVINEDKTVVATLEELKAE